MPTVKHDGLKKRCGCAKRRWSDCGHPWHFSQRFRGTEHRLSLDVVAGARGQLPPRSKAAAVQLRDALRAEIKGGTFVDPAAAPTPQTADTRLTFTDVADRYLREYVQKPTRRTKPLKNMEYQIGVLRRTLIPAAKGTMIALGDKPMADLTPDDVEAVRTARRAHYQSMADRLNAEQPDADLKSIRRAGEKAGEVGINRLLTRLRHICSWALTRRPALMCEHPFKQHGEPIVMLESSAEHGRTRRLVGDEEERLLEHAQDHLRALIVAALETGCRVGELLALQWKNIKWADVKGVPTMVSFTLSAEKTKTSRRRDVGITGVLRGFLEMRRHVPSEPPQLRETLGDVYGPEHYVFGNELGEPVTTVYTAWKATLRRAVISNLHFHDLRREFGSRFLEAGNTIAEVQQVLGHSNPVQTCKYLGVTDAGMGRAFSRFEESRILRTSYAHEPKSAGTPTLTEESNDVANVLH